MYSDMAIKVENLSKCYQIYDNPRDRLRQFVMPRLSRAFGCQPHHYYREFWALKHVSFEVKKGETVGIIGRNGSGKSTLLQMICGTLNPTDGCIKTNGRVAALLELGSGFNPEFTGRENVYMNAAVIGLDKGEIDARFNDILAFADIGDFIHQPVKTYSSGMMVRLAFAVAINTEPQILIVDEALSVGDELFQRKCFSRIEAIRKRGTTILLVSHSASTIIELCDRALLLDEGENLAMGLPKYIVGQYQRLIYAPDEKHKAIREEIGDTKTTKSQSDHHVLNKNYPESKSETSGDNNLQEFYDPNLVSQSMMEYLSKGAWIESAQILTMSGRKVNCLKRGMNYRYKYNVRFDKCASNVRFGMLIKTITGFQLGGSVSAHNSNFGIELVPKGSRFCIEFSFTCNLNPGTYFLNSGVLGVLDEEETYLHRVKDICIFKVLPITNNTATAIVDFNFAVQMKLLQGVEREPEYHDCG